MIARSALACLLLIACQDGDDKNSGSDSRVDSSADASAEADGSDPADALGDGDNPDAVDATNIQDQTGGDATIADAPDSPDSPDGTAPSDATVPDSDATSTSEIGDVTGAPAGTACIDEDECNSGWCVPSAIGQVCVDICVDACDAGEACIPAADSGTDPVFLCVPFVGPPGPDTIGGDSDDSTISSDGEDDGDDSTISSDGEDDTDDSTISSDGEDTGPVDDTVITDAGPDGDDGTIISDGDQDDDGIPDDEDNLPCLAVWLIVYNVDVTSASMILNGVEVISANQFPTEETITVFINPTTGENTIDLGGKLTGSPSDRLVLVVIDSNDTIWFSTMIEREPGKPEAESFTFTIDATCP